MTAGIERRVAIGGGHDLVYDDYGPQTGEPVVLCHGLGAAGLQFDADAQALSRLGFRVLVPDLRGHGRSGKPDPAVAENYAIAAMAADLVAMLDAAGAGRVHHVGNSLGGILALHLLADHADRFATLATFGTAMALNLPRFTPGLVPWSYRLTGARLMGKLTAWGTTPSPEGRAIVETMIAGFDPQVGRAVTQAVHRYDLFDNAAGFSRPYLMIVGSKDRQVNAALKRFIPRLLALPQFSLVEIEGAGHCANLDRPEAFRETVLEFWAKNPIRFNSETP